MMWLLLCHESLSLWPFPVTCTSRACSASLMAIQILLPPPPCLDLPKFIPPPLTPPAADVSCPASPTALFLCFFKPACFNFNFQSGPLQPCLSSVCLSGYPGSLLLILPCESLLSPLGFVPTVAMLCCCLHPGAGPCKSCNVH